MFAYLLELIEKIPATFWGIVIGSILSLSGVIVSNRSNDRRFDKQLAHERELKKQERDLSLRKEVYLDAAEAIHAGVLSLVNFANLDIPYDKLNLSYIEKSPAIAKAHVIAKENTAASIMKLSSELAAAYLRLTIERIPLDALKTNINFLKEQSDRAIREEDRILELMRQYNIKGETDKVKWDTLQSIFDFEQKKVGDNNKEQENATNSLIPAQIELMRNSLDETTKLSRLLVPVIATVRAELDLPFDQVSYSALVEESIQHQEESISKFIQQLQPMVSQSIPQNDDTPT